jgi:hypothetical protein
MNSIEAPAADVQGCQEGCELGPTVVYSATMRPGRRLSPRFSSSAARLMSSSPVFMPQKDVRNTSLPRCLRFRVYRLGCCCTFECSVSGGELQPPASSEVIQSHSSCNTSRGQCGSTSHTITCSPATGAAGRARCRLQSHPDAIDLDGRAHVKTTPDCCRRACLHAGARRTTGCRHLFG